MNEDVRLRKPALYAEYSAVLEQLGEYWLDANLYPHFDDEPV